MTEGTPVKKVTPKPQPTLEHLREWEKGILRDNYEFGDKELSMLEPKLDKKSGRLFLPILSVYGAQIGFNLRAIDGITPKSLVTLERADMPLASFYGGGGDQLPCILVEDQFSAVKIACAVPNVNVVSLMGTSLDPFKAGFIQRSLRPKPLVFALDPDAISKAVSYMSKFRSLFVGGVKFLELERDPKDTPREDIVDMINGIISES